MVFVVCAAMADDTIRICDASGCADRLRRTANFEAGAGAVDVMHTIKRALDPDDILNPDKIFAL